MEEGLEWRRQGTRSHLHGLSGCPAQSLLLLRAYGCNEKETHSSLNGTFRLTHIGSVPFPDF